MLPDWVGLFDSNPSTSGQWHNSQYFYMKVCAQTAAKIHTFVTSETDSDGPDNLGGPVLTILTLGTWRLGHKDYVASITAELHLSKRWLYDWLGPLGKFVENSTKLTCLEITDLWIKYSIVLWLLELQSGVVKKFRCSYILQIVNSLALMVCRSNSDVLILCYNYLALMVRRLNSDVLMLCYNYLALMVRRSNNDVLMLCHYYLALMVCRSNSDVLILCYNYLALMVHMSNSDILMLCYNYWVLMVHYHAQSLPRETTFSKFKCIQKQKVMKQSCQCWQGHQVHSLRYALQTIQMASSEQMSVWGAHHCLGAGN